MATTRKILITSASGHIGQRLVPLLQSAHPTWQLYLPTRNASSLQTLFPSLSASPTATALEGSIQDPQWLETTLKTNNIDTVFLNLTGTDELFTSLNAISSILRAGCVKSIVYLSALGDFSPAALTAAPQAGSAQTAPPNGSGGGGDVPQPTVSPWWLAANVAVKALVEAAVGGLPSSIGWIALGPSMFFTNDERAKGVLADGVWLEPFGDKGASRVALGDIALAAERAMVYLAADREGEGKEWRGQKIWLGTKRAYTDEDMTRLWSEALGQDVQRDSSPAGMDRLENVFREHVGAAWARDLRLMYETIRDHGFGFIGERGELEYEKQLKFLGREPTPYEPFVKELAKAWVERK